MKSFSERPTVLTAPQAGSIEPVEWRLEDTRVVEPPAPDESYWQAEVAAAYERGQADGFARGVEEGRRQESERHAQQIARGVASLEAAARAIQEAEAPSLEALERNLTALAVAVARHLVGRELRSDAGAIADLVRRALAEFPADEPLRVRIHPNDLSTLTTVPGIDGEPIAIAPGRELRWIADPEIEPGGCVVEGRERIVDGRVDRALERIYRSLVDD